MTQVPENALRARELYVQGKPTLDILIETKLTRWALYHWLDGGPVDAGRPALPPIAKRHPRRGRGEPKRRQLVERLLSAAERQIADIESRLEGTQQEPGATERNVRTLAVLAKTVQSLAAQQKKGAPKTKAPKHEPVPRSIDELRRSLTRKLEAIIAEQHSGAAGTGK